MRVLVIAACLLGAGSAFADAMPEGDVEAYCTARARVAQPTGGGTRGAACVVLVRGALDALAAHKVLEAVDQIRAVDELMRPHPVAHTCPPAPACPPTVECPPPPAFRPPATKHLRRPRPRVDLQEPNF